MPLTKNNRDKELILLRARVSFLEYALRVIAQTPPATFCDSTCKSIVQVAKNAVEE